MVRDNYSDYLKITPAHYKNILFIKEVCPIDRPFSDEPVNEIQQVKYFFCHSGTTTEIIHEDDSNIIATKLDQIIVRFSDSELNITINVVRKEDPTTGELFIDTQTFFSELRVDYITLVEDTIERIIEVIRMHFTQKLQTNAN